MKGIQQLPGDRDKGGSDGERDTKVCKADFKGERYVHALDSQSEGLYIP